MVKLEFATNFVDSTVHRCRSANFPVQCGDNFDEVDISFNCTLNHWLEIEKSYGAFAIPNCAQSFNYSIMAFLKENSWLVSTHTQMCKFMITL